MDGIFNPKWYNLNDSSTFSNVLTCDAPDDVLCLNEELKNLIDSDIETGGGKDSINAGLTRFTGWKFFNKTTDHLMSWVAHVIKTCYLNPETNTFLPVMTQVWGMKYEKNDVSPAHNHFPSLVSWTYYPYIENSEKVQPLELCKVPTGNIEIDISMCAEHVQDKTKHWGEPILSIPPHTGQLVVFPAYAYHQVKPVLETYGRYCIAGNVSHDFDASTMVNV